MMRSKMGWLALLVGLGLAGWPTAASAHCDTMDGPVVKAGQRALESGALAPALIWIDTDSEAELREAFATARDVRGSSPKARTLADRWFLETLVRLHRAGEGQPYTGLKPAGTPVNPAVAAADKAVAGGSLEPVLTLLDEAMRHGLEERFARVRATRGFAPTDIAAGRAFVRAYVPFVHQVEGVFEAAAGEAAHHH